MSFLPEPAVRGSVSFVIDDITETCDNLDLDSDVTEKIDEVAMYFNNNYEENRLPNRPPKFDIPLWNHHKSTTEGIARTNNSVEGWHYGIQAFFNGSHPNMWTVLKNLKKDMALQKYNYLQTTQRCFPTRRQKYEKINQMA